VRALKLNDRCKSASCLVQQRDHKSRVIGKEDMMRNIVFTALGAAAMFAFAAPAMAQDQWDYDVHDQLDQQHADAHDEGLSPWEHRQLHRELRYEHAQADYQIARQHQQEHWRDQYRRRYQNYGYRGY
jgi:hypothetical protein